MNETELEVRRKRRRRTLRAAQVVTLGLALAGGGGCYATHTRTHDPEPELADVVQSEVPEAGVPDVMVRTQDAGVPDVVVPTLDAGTLDAAVADAGLCECSNWEGDEIQVPCGAFEDGTAWGEWGCAAWGPYMPPGDGALPESRSARLRV